MLRVLIVDDEPLARRRLEILLRELPDATLVGTAADGLAAGRLIEELAPDVVLLDIKMPGRTGLEVLDELSGAGAPGGTPSWAPIVIFVTAFDRFAIDAFERAAFGYLLKPVEPARLAAALARARTALAERAAAERARELEEVLANLRGGAQAPSPYLASLWIAERGGRCCVAVGVIDWIAAERDYVRIHTGARSYLIRQSIGGLEARLDPGEFLRVHRSSLVRRDRIVRIRHAAGRGAVVLTTGAEVPVSRRHMGAVKALAEAG
jgi:two-component system LytT family response regulator/two-component system response regulator AlgR